MAMSRRRILQIAATGSALVVMPRSGQAQSYPTQPITLLVFVPAGGAPDIVARVIASALSKRLGQPVIIENRPGGGGNLALQAAARAPADGHTLLLIATPHAVNVTLYEKLNVNLTNDIVPVASIDDDAFAMLVNPSMTATSVPELIAHIKANPGKINMASSGTGNLSHLAGELFKMMTATEMLHVPYRGAPAANTAVMTGESHVLFNALPSVLSLIREGKLRALAVTTEKRTKFLPEIPTLGASVPGYAVTGWVGIGVPKGTPPEIIDRLNKETNAALADAETLARLDSLGSEPFASSPAEFGKFIAVETEKWRKVVRFSNLKVD